MNVKERRSAAEADEAVRRVRRARGLAMLGVLGVVMVICGVSLMGREWQRSSFGFAQAPALGTALWLAGLVMTAVSFLLLRRRASSDDPVPRCAGERLWSRRRLWACLAALLAFLTWKSVQGVWLVAAGAGHGLNTLMLLGGPVASGLVLMGVAGIDLPSVRGPVPKDDPLRGLRRRALATLPWTVGVGLLVLGALWFWHPEATAAGVPAVLFLMAATAAFRFGLLRRRSEGEGRF